MNVILFVDFAILNITTTSNLTYFWLCFVSPVTGFSVNIQTKVNQAFETERTHLLIVFTYMRDYSKLYHDMEIMMPKKRN